MKGTSIGASVVALVGAAALPAGTATTAVVRRSDQDGLVNVNLQSPQRAIPVSGAFPVDAAASVRGVDVPTIREQGGPRDATHTSAALRWAVARALVGQST